MSSCFCTAGFNSCGRDEECPRLSSLKEINTPEYKFWEKLRQEIFQPDPGDFVADADLKC